MIIGLISPVPAPQIQKSFFVSPAAQPFFSKKEDTCLPSCLLPLDLGNAGGAAQAGYDLAEVTQIVNFNIDQCFEKILLALHDF